jgi:hypothetical protein
VSLADPAPLQVRGICRDGQWWKDQDGHKGERLIFLIIIISSLARR